MQVTSILPTVPQTVLLHSDYSLCTLNTTRKLIKPERAIKPVRLHQNLSLRCLDSLTSEAIYPRPHLPFSSLPHTIDGPLHLIMSGPCIHHETKHSPSHLQAALTLHHRNTNKTRKCDQKVHLLLSWSDLINIQPSPAIDRPTLILHKEREKARQRERKEPPSFTHVSMAP